jgi:hypothetical protein
LLRILVFATTFVDNLNKARLLDYWLTIGLGLNSNCDLLLVDSASPHTLFVSPERGALFKKVEVTSSNLAADLRGRYTLAAFPDNIGHAFRDGADGWGRAIMCGLQTAVARGYDYVVHIEGDLLFRLDVTSIVAPMHAHGIGALSTIEPVNFFLETGILFFSTQFVERSNLIERYNWRDLGSTRFMEQKLERLLGDDLFLKKWVGMRNRNGGLTINNIGKIQPVWITQSKDPRTYDEFMKLTGLLSLPA